MRVDESRCARRSMAACVFQPSVPHAAQIQHDALLWIAEEQSACASTWLPFVSKENPGADDIPFRLCCNSLGGIRMAIRVAELARAGLAPDWMKDAHRDIFLRETIAATQKVVFALRSLPVQRR